MRRRHVCHVGAAAGVSGTQEGGGTAAGTGAVRVGAYGAGLGWLMSLSQLRQPLRDGLPFRAVAEDHGFHGGIVGAQGLCCPCRRLRCAGQA